jgi:hypothetical protein
MSLKMQMVCAIVAGMALAGCAAEQSQGQGGAATAADTKAKPLAAPSASAMRVVSGFAPRSYMVTTGGYLFVKDTTANKIIYDGAVVPNTLVKIDPTMGVTVGDKVVVGGPLPGAHHYEIWLDRNPKMQ